MNVYSVFCDPQFGQTLRTDCATGFSTGVINASAGCSAIFGGTPSATPSNCIESDLSFIMMGDYHFMCCFDTQRGMFNSIYNGHANNICGCLGTIFNGCSGTIFGSFFSDIMNGTTSRTGCMGGPLYKCYASVGNGNTNYAYGCYTRASNGNTSELVGCYLTSLNGEAMRLGAFHAPVGPDDTCFSTLVNGCDNRIDYSEGSIIMNGSCNCVRANWSFIGSGCNNEMVSALGSSSTSAIVSGVCNCFGTRVTGSFIGSGVCHNIFGNQSSIVSGQTNTVGSNNSIIGSGEVNTISQFANASAIVGGNVNCIDGNAIARNSYSFIGAGRGNQILSGALRGAIGGGGLNTIGTSAEYSFIGGGELNITTGDWSSVTGGCCNVSGVASNVNGGHHNQAIGSSSFIASGNFNQVSSNNSSIGAGYSNKINANISGIVGGQLNCIEAAANFGFIGGGTNNHIGSVVASNLQRSTILGGNSNFIDSDPTNASIALTIGGGRDNTLCGAVLTSAGAIMGGRQNTVAGYSATILGGCLNVIGGVTTAGSVPQSQFSFIGGGRNNRILSSAAMETCFAAIGGGENNTIDVAADCSAVVGGTGNTVNANASFSSIMGGENNALLGDYSVIMGGINNNDAGNNNIFIAGSAVAGIALVGGNGGMFANELVITNIAFAPTPAVYATLQPGQVYTDTMPGSGYGLNDLFIV